MNSSITPNRHPLSSKNLAAENFDRLRTETQTILQSRFISLITFPLHQLLETAAEYAETQGWHLYLVGGGVRDLLLVESDEPLTINDLDLVVDGFHQPEPAAVGVKLARLLHPLYPQARLEIHDRFQTATLLWQSDPQLGSLWVDFATARQEFYAYPGANPHVSPCNIHQDLCRRDFTINALALELTNPHKGRLLDPFGGVLDLKDQQIRVLHAESFIEDPTRVYRAVRFAVRLGFRIESQTLSYIHEAFNDDVYERTQAEHTIVPALQTRLKAELKCILEAPYWQSALLLLAELRALQCIHVTLKLTLGLWQQLRLSDRALYGLTKLDRGSQNPMQINAPPWQIRLELLIAALEPEYRLQAATKLQLSADTIQRLNQLADIQSHLETNILDCQKPSKIVETLQRYDSLTLFLIGIKTNVILRRKIWHYFTRWLRMASPLTGHDLKRMGYKPGKPFKQILQEVFAAYLDGELGYDRGSQDDVRSAAETFVKTHYPLG